jgi:hypothetical protein
MPIAFPKQKMNVVFLFGILLSYLFVDPFSSCRGRRGKGNNQKYAPSPKERWAERETFVRNGINEIRKKKKKNNMAATISLKGRFFCEVYRSSPCRS